jgi:hypothetical protein
VVADSERNGCSRGSHGLLALALIWLSLGAASSAHGGWVPDSAHDVPGHDCACDTCRGRSCCCLRLAIKRSAPHAPNQRTSNRASATDSICVGAAPCGRDGLPPAPPTYRASQALDSLSVTGLPRFSDDREVVPHPTSEVATSEVPMPLDDPPEFSA